MVNSGQNQKTGLIPIQKRRIKDCRRAFVKESMGMYHIQTKITAPKVYSDAYNEKFNIEGFDHQMRDFEIGIDINLNPKIYKRLERAKWPIHTLWINGWFHRNQNEIYYNHDYYDVYNIFIDNKPICPEKTKRSKPI